MFRPEDLEEIAEINRIADEITTRTDMGQQDDEGEEGYKEYKKAPQDDDEDEKDKPMDS